MTISLQGLIDDAKCYQTVRDLRGSEGVRCPHCAAAEVVKNGHDTEQVHRQRYRCNACHRGFDDLTGTIFAGHHQPLRVWMVCSYFMGLNWSNRQIGAELGLSTTQAHEMTTQLRQGMMDRQPPVTLSGAVECDEVYVVAGHKGRPEAVKKSPYGSSAASQGRAGPGHA